MSEVGGREGKSCKKRRLQAEFLFILLLPTQASAAQEAGIRRIVAANGRGRSERHGALLRPMRPKQ